MSLFNGDKARSHRRRKQNIQRRLRNQALIQGSTAGKQSGAKKPEKRPSAS